MISSQPFFVPALLFVAAALPLVLGLVPPNRFYGVRTAKTLADPGLWLRANRLAGLLVVAASVVYLIVAKVTPTADGKDLTLWLGHLAAFALPLAVAVWSALRSARAP